MSGEHYTNTASVAEVAAPVGPSDTTATLNNFDGYPAVPFWAEFEKGTQRAEIVRVTNVAGNVITMTRGQGGTAATSHGAGVTFEHVAPAAHFNDFETHRAATSAHGVVGNIVGTSGAQTIQDKLFRGATRSNHSDTLPAGITASFEAVADTTAARDGFVHNNTGGDVDRRGFLLRQGGSDRFQVFNDGTVDIAPGTSTRPGLHNSSTTELDGAVTLGDTLQVAGAVDLNDGLDVSGGLVTSGGAIITGNTELDTVEIESLDATGAITGASLSISGAATVNELTSTTHVTAYGGRVIPVVSSTSDVTSPVANQIVWVGPERMLYRWNGSAWVRTDMSVPRAELAQTATQAIGSGAWTPLEFQTEVLDSHGGHATTAQSFVVPAGWGGRLKLRGGVGFTAAGGTGRGVRWTRNGEVCRSGAKTIGNEPSVNMVFDAKSITIEVVEGDAIRLEAWHNRGSDLNTILDHEYQSYMSIEWTVA